MKQVILFLLFFSFTLSAQEQIIFMRNALYHKNDICVFQLKPSNKIIIGKIYDTIQLNDSHKDSLSKQQFLFPIGLDSSKIVAYEEFNLKAYFKEKQTIEKWGTSDYQILLRENALTRRSSWQNGDPLLIHIHRISLGENNLFNRRRRLRRNQRYTRPEYTRAFDAEGKIDAQIEFITTDSILYALSASKTQIVKLDLSNNVIAKRPIVIKEPSVFSNKKRYLVKDKQTHTNYLIIQTNFEYNIYEINLKHGKAVFLKSLAQLKENPRWNITNGVLINPNSTEEIDLYNTKKDAKD